MISITIPDSVKEIGSHAFSHCENLTTITLPKYITELSCGLLSDCKNLTTLVIPDNVKKIHYEALPRQLKNITIKNPKLLAGQFCSISGKEEMVINGEKIRISKLNGGCYVATCVYGSYDCPEVWTLRRYRDNTLASTWYGRAFIRMYYAISPTLVKLFGDTKWFKKMWKGKLDRMVKKLQEKGVENTPYEDKNWN